MWAGYLYILSVFPKYNQWVVLSLFWECGSLGMIVGYLAWVYILRKGPFDVSF